MVRIPQPRRPRINLERRLSPGVFTIKTPDQRAILQAKKDEKLNSEFTGTWNRRFNYVTCEFGHKKVINLETKVDREIIIIILRCQTIENLAAAHPNNVGKLQMVLELQ